MRLFGETKIQASGRIENSIGNQKKLKDPGNEGRIEDL